MGNNLITWFNFKLEKQYLEFLNMDMQLGVRDDEHCQKIMEGFRINWMHLKSNTIFIICPFLDAENGVILWECHDWKTNLLDRTEIFPKEILKCGSVGRAINFSSREKIDNFKLVQRIWLFGKIIEEWDFDFGFVIPNSTNTWEQIIDAAEEEDMLSAEIISGNIKIETLFFNRETVVYRSNLTVIYQ